MLYIPIEQFLDCFVLIYHLLSILSSLQFRIIRFVSNNATAKSCCCKLVAKHKEVPMILASDVSECLNICRDQLQPGYVASLSEKAQMPIQRDEKFKYAKSSVLSLYYSLQDIREEMNIILEHLSDVIDILKETDPSLMLWDEFQFVVPAKLDMLIMNISKIMIAFEVPLRPIPPIQLGHRFFFETGRLIFQRRCEKLTESMLKVHATGYHSR